MSSRGIGFESVAPRKLLASVSACLPRGCLFSEKTSRNLPWKVLACCPPCRPSRGNAYMFLRERKSNRSEDPWHESSALRSTAENGARCRGISADVHCRWAEEIAHRETHRRKEKCSRRCDRRYTGNPP